MNANGRCNAVRRWAGVDGEDVRLDYRKVARVQRLETYHGMIQHRERKPTTSRSTVFRSGGRPSITSGRIVVIGVPSRNQARVKPYPVSASVSFRPARFLPGRRRLGLSRCRSSPLTAWTPRQSSPRRPRKVSTGRAVHPVDGQVRLSRARRRRLTVGPPPSVSASPISSTSIIVHVLGGDEPPQAAATAEPAVDVGPSDRCRGPGESQSWQSTITRDRPATGIVSANVFGVERRIQSVPGPSLYRRGSVRCPCSG